MHRIHIHRHDERGSIPMALLVMIVLSGLIAVLLSRTVAGTRAAGFDNDFTPVVHAADVGAQQATYKITRSIDPSLDVTPSGSTLSGSGSVPEGDYEWDAVRCGGTPQPARCTEEGVTDPLTWVVTSTATQNDTSRQVVTLVRDHSRFEVALFAAVGIDMNGNNTASSYPSGDMGVIATNGDVRLHGSSTTVDGVHLYNWDADPDIDRCNGNDCDDVRSDPPIAPSAQFGPPLDLSVAHIAFIEEQLAACGPAADLQPLTYENTTLPRPGQSNVVCGSSLYLDNVTMTAPMQFYISGNVSFPKQTKVNCVQCTLAERPVASDLQIYTLGDTVYFGQNHLSIAAAIFAPNAFCDGRAQTTIFGTLICKSLDTNGGWEFYYDERLGDIGGAGFQEEEWRENTAG